MASMQGHVEQAGVRAINQEAQTCQIWFNKQFHETDTKCNKLVEDRYSSYEKHVTIRQILC
eukprot:8531831-Prorocentrum_lima.AAC.1